jgi:hypothetical protein
MVRFQELAEQIRDELGVRSAILDGEIVSLDEQRRHIFRRMLAGPETPSSRSASTMATTGYSRGSPRGQHLPQKPSELERPAELQ